MHAVKAAHFESSKKEKWMSRVYERLVQLVVALPAKIPDFAAVTFGRSSVGRRREMGHRSTFFRGFTPRLAAGIGFPIKGLSHRSRTPHIAQEKNFHVEISALVPDLQAVASADLASRFRKLSIDLDSP